MRQYVYFASNFPHSFPLLFTGFVSSSVCESVCNENFNQPCSAATLTFMSSLQHKFSAHTCHDALTLPSPSLPTLSRFLFSSRLPFATAANKNKHTCPVAEPGSLPKRVPTTQDNARQPGGRMQQQQQQEVGGVGHGRGRGFCQVGEDKVPPPQ